jgi:hypothetical protein
MALEITSEKKLTLPRRDRPPYQPTQIGAIGLENKVPERATKIWRISNYHQSGTHAFNYSSNSKTLHLVMRSDQEIKTILLVAPVCDNSEVARTNLLSFLLNQ